MAHVCFTHFEVCVCMGTKKQQRLFALSSDSNHGSYRERKKHFCYNSQKVGQKLQHRSRWQNKAVAGRVISHLKQAIWLQEIAANTICIFIFKRSTDQRSVKIKFDFFNRISYKNNCTSIDLQIICLQSAQGPASFQQKVTQPVHVQLQGQATDPLSGGNRLLTLILKVCFSPSKVPATPKASNRT